MEREFSSVEKRKKEKGKKKAMLTLANLLLGTGLLVLLHRVVSWWLEQGKGGTTVEDGYKDHKTLKLLHTDPVPPSGIAPDIQFLASCSDPDDIEVRPLSCIIIW